MQCDQRGIQRLEELIEKTAGSSFGALQELNDYGQQIACSMIAKIPNGPTPSRITWTMMDRMLRIWRFRFASCGDDAIEADFTGTAAQARAISTVPVGDGRGRVLRFPLSDAKRDTACAGIFPDTAQGTRSFLIKCEAFRCSGSSNVETQSRIGMWFWGPEPGAARCHSGMQSGTMNNLPLAVQGTRWGTIQPSPVHGGSKNFLASVAVQTT